MPLALELSNIWKIVSEIIILWFIYYMVLLFIRGSRTVQVIKGLIIILLVLVLTQQFGLTTINWIITKIFPISVLAFLIIFQPELRRGLARLGQFGAMLKEEKVIDEIVKSTSILSKKKIGAIIAIEREIGLRPYIESGVVIDSKVTSELINTIFMPNTPLHDGGIIIQGASIVAAGCLFPLSHDQRLSKTMGTRHRAAMGLTEETDAVVVVISEETGAISVSIAGKLTRDLDKETLSKILNNLFNMQKHRKSIFDFLGRKASES
ncbi:MAG: TIGR00159 family protein [Candidatus Omnitrophica bacterium]|nr:TIGR00159 family protein [Candidatus Omnitrophota bacterium]